LWLAASNASYAGREGDDRFILCDVGWKLVHIKLTTFCF
jgi:hypothetical protein